MNSDATSVQMMRLWCCSVPASRVFKDDCGWWCIRRTRATRLDFSSLTGGTCFFVLRVQSPVWCGIVLVLRLVPEAVHLRLVCQHARANGYKAERKQEYPGHPHGLVPEPHEADHEGHRAAQAKAQANHCGCQRTPQAGLVGVARKAEHRGLHSFTNLVSTDVTKHTSITGDFGAVLTTADAVACP